MAQVLDQEHVNMEPENNDSDVPLNCLRPSVGNDEIEIENDDLYIVSTGETLWSIAKLIYKDEYAWSILLHDNKEKLKNPDKIYPGYPLSIRTRLVESGDEN